MFWKKIVKVWQMIVEFWKNHICDDFPKIYPEQCFVCNKDNCPVCPYYK